MTFPSETSHLTSAQGAPYSPSMPLSHDMTEHEKNYQGVVIDAASHLIDGGITVIPVDLNKKPLGDWKCWQYNQMSKEQFARKTWHNTKSG